MNVKPNSCPFQTETTKSYDPYDLWMTPVGVFAKRGFYQNKLHGKILSVSIGLLDWLLPSISRKLFGAVKRHYPITVAQSILCQTRLENPHASLDLLLSTASNRTGEFGLCWGLGFDWMSKNGLYDSNIPFVTHSPYGLEALLKLASDTKGSDPELAGKAMNSFAKTRTFFDSLKVMQQSTDTLALSYAPVIEPRIVVNANSYACYSYALHAIHGTSAPSEARGRALKLAHWVVQQQEENGSWYYYADREPGNFIDCFHTCFVLKNLIKTVRLLPELESTANPAIEKGLDYLENHFLDKKRGLMRRFVVRDIKDPFVWDIYDQAEYLGLLVLLGRKTDAENFSEVIHQNFIHKGEWHCRIDFFGRHWGKNYLRWGIMPLHHQLHELKQLASANSAI